MVAWSWEVVTATTTSASNIISHYCFSISEHSDRHKPVQVGNFKIHKSNICTAQQPALYY